MIHEGLVAKVGGFGGGEQRCVGCWCVCERQGSKPDTRHSPIAPRQDLAHIAKKRLRTFSHVGTTEQLFESVESCAGSLGMPLDGPAYAGGEVSR
jgi:hypothetical protein